MTDDRTQSEDEFVMVPESLFRLVRDRVITPDEAWSRVEQMGEWKEPA